MKCMVLSLSACLVGLLVGVNLGAADEKPPKEPLSKREVFAAFRQTLEPYGGSVEKAKLSNEKRKQAGKLLASVSRSVKFLEETTREQNLPKPYLVSLTWDSWLLKKSRTALEDGEEREKGITQLRFVATDLETKKASIGAAKGTAKLVKVVVETKDSTATSQKGYEVYYVVQGMVDYPVAYERYPQLSTPTAEDVAPGEYFFWTEKDKKMGKRTPVKVRDNGTGRRDVDIPTP